MPKAKVTRKFRMPDGNIKEEHEMTEVELQKFSQKIMDVLLAPLAYDAVIRDLQRDKDFTS